jgi:hypothetical protein
VEWGEPWTDDQSALADVLMVAWAQYAQWPIFQYVSSELARRGIRDAAGVLASFPDFGVRSPTTRSYCDVRFDHTYPGPPPDSEVSLTISGLARHHAGGDMAKAFVGVLAYAAEKYSRTPMDATKLVEVEVTSGELAATSEFWWPDYSLHAAGVLMKTEWPRGMQSMASPQDAKSWMIHVGQDVLRYKDATVEDYIAGVERDIESAAAETSKWLGSPVPESGVDAEEVSETGVQRMSPRRAVGELSKLAQKASDDPRVRVTGPTHEQWKAQVRAVMERALGRDSSVLNDFNRLKYHVGIWSGAPGEVERDQRFFASKVDSAVAYIEAAVFELDLDDTSSGGAMATDLPSGVQTSGDVFLVHGHDAEAKHQVARIVQRLTNHEPVILDEQASRSRTVIEKFEDHGGAAAFAIVLLTPDDVGGADKESLNPRARQNVVFELGFFVGRLGRGRVVALTKGNVELPSDIAGVVYIPLDKDDWSHQLGREMRGVDGLDVDLNRL